MTTSVRQQRLRSHLKTAGVCFGAFLLVYATSFYTRDWRTVVPQPGQANAEHRPVRPMLATPVMEAALTEAPIRHEPEVTGSLPKEAEPVAHLPARAAVQASTPTQASAAPSSPKQTRPAPPRSRVQSKPNKPTQTAAIPTAKPPTTSDAAPAPTAAPVQFQLAERGN